MQVILTAVIAPIPIYIIAINAVLVNNKNPFTFQPHYQQSTYYIEGHLDEKNVNNNVVQREGVCSLRKTPQPSESAFRAENDY